MRQVTWSYALNSGWNSDVSITWWENSPSDSEVMHKVSGSIVPSLEWELNRNKLRWQGNILCLPTERLSRCMQFLEENHNWKYRWVEVVNRWNSKAWKQPVDWLVQIQLDYRVVVHKISRSGGWRPQEIYIVSHRASNWLLCSWPFAIFHSFFVVWVYSLQGGIENQSMSP